MNQHTKGSWTFDKTTWRVTGGDNSVVCNVVPWDVTGYRQEDLDNGNLIAAAPDLYHALATLIGHTDDSDYMSWDEQMTLAKKALAKARGENE